MQISDFFGQYELNANANTKGTEVVSESGQTSASKELSQMLRNLFAGDIFEATVNEIKNNEVLLGLENGQTVQARLQAQVPLHVGESMFFQIKSNQGTQIEIKPFPMGAEGNPTLLKALDAAGLKVTDKNLSLVHSMMEQQLPIDKDSLLSMVRLCGSHPSIPRSTLVEMTKYQIPVTEENAAVFENYKMDQGKMEGQLELLFHDLPQKLADDSVSGKEITDFHNQLVQILTETGEQETISFAAKEKELLPKQNFSTTESQEMTGSAAGSAVENEEQVQTTLNVTEENVNVAKTKQQMPPVQAETFMENTKENVLSKEMMESSTLGHTMKQEELVELNQTLSNLTGEEADVSDMTAKQLLYMVKNLLSGEKTFPEEKIRNLFSKKSYQQVLRNALEEEWLLKPKDLADDEKRQDFYTKMNRQIGQFSELLSQNIKAQGKTMQALSDVRNNLQFMHVLNQTYTYMQIPLKMSNQNAQGDLYVYTNKKNLREKEGELSAFLHLDLEHLGSTDVSVKMFGKKVDTRFYLSDDASYKVILEHASLLEEQLSKKGYHCTIEVENDAKKPDFVEDLLQRGKPVGGALHRYSFDMRA